METVKDKKRKKEVSKNKTSMPSTTETDEVPRPRARAKKVAVVEMPPNSPVLNPRRMMTRAFARRLAQAGEPADMFSLSKLKIKLTPTAPKKNKKIEPDTDSNSSTSEPEPKPKPRAKKQKRNDDGRKESDLPQPFVPKEPKKQKLTGKKNTKVSNKVEVQKPDLLRASPAAPDLKKKKSSQSSTGLLLPEDETVDFQLPGSSRSLGESHKQKLNDIIEPPPVPEVEVQEPFVPQEPVTPEIKTEKLKVDIMNHATRFEGDQLNSNSPAPGTGTPSFGSKKMKLHNTPLATLFEDEIQESDSDSLGPSTPRQDMNRTYVILGNDSEADQSVLFLDETDASVSFSPADNYNITLFHEYDENMTHREGKEISKWAKSKDFVNEQLFRTQPNLIKILNGRRMDYLIFPVVDSRKKLFPGAPKPKI